MHADDVRRARRERFANERGGFGHRAEKVCELGVFEGDDQGVGVIDVSLCDVD